MPIARGVEVYNADASRVLARGFLYTQAELDLARADRIPAILVDEVARAELTELYTGLELTEFGVSRVVAALQPLPPEPQSRGWREGEALAEAWLVDHQQCEFPWSFNRDLRHPRASLPGAELVGFAGAAADDVRIAFGQVKTSKELRHPPQIVTRGATSLISQLRQLRDDANIKSVLVNYMGFRACSEVPWRAKFQSAAKRYFESGSLEIAIFGMLVRDTQPDAADLSTAAIALERDGNAAIRIEIYCLNLPLGSIPEGPQRTNSQRNSPS